VTLQDETISEALIYRLRAQLTGSSSALDSFSPSVIELVQTVRRKNLTFLSDKKLARLARLCEIAMQANSNGLFIEAGCGPGMGRNAPMRYSCTFDRNSFRPNRTANFLVMPTADIAARTVGRGCSG
jgi:hypothetical protein